VVEVTADGTVVMHSTNVRLVPYALFDGLRQLPRLATVTSDLRRRTDAEGDDPASTVSVTIDDLSATPPRRLATFADPGSEGVLLGEPAHTRQPGCCAGPTPYPRCWRPAGCSSRDRRRRRRLSVGRVANARLIRRGRLSTAVDEAAQKRGGSARWSWRDATLSRLGPPEAARSTQSRPVARGQVLWVDAASQKADIRRPPAAPRIPTIWC
jgi:hypothetical protein